MQINAINSSANRISYKGTETATPSYSETLGTSDYDKGIEVIEKALTKANSDVHPATIITTVVATVATAAAMMKITPAVRKGIIKMGEFVASTATKVGGAIVNKFKSEENKIDITKITENISAKSKEIMQGKIYKEGEETLANKVVKHVKDVFGEKAGESTQAFFDKANVKNATDTPVLEIKLTAPAAFNTIARTLDPVSDKTEEQLDRKTMTDAVDVAVGIIS